MWVARLEAELGQILSTSHGGGGMDEAEVSATWWLLALASCVVHACAYITSFGMAEC
jgi:hypothetical protein